MGDFKGMGDISFDSLEEFFREKLSMLKGLSEEGDDDEEKESIDEFISIELFMSIEMFMSILLSPFGGEEGKSASDGGDDSANMYSPDVFSNFFLLLLSPCREQ